MTRDMQERPGGHDAPSGSTDDGAGSGSASEVPGTRTDGGQRGRDTTGGRSGSGSGQRTGGQPPGGSSGGSPATPPPNDGPSLGRRLGVVLLGIVLTACVATAVPIFAVQDTALSGDYVADTLGETNATAEVEALAEDSIVDQTSELAGAGYVPQRGTLVEGTVRDLITESYVDGVLSRNLDSVFAYLKGRQSELALAVNTTPVKSDVGATVTARLSGDGDYDGVTVPELIRSGEFAGAFSVSGVSIDADTIASTYENPADFRRVQDRYDTALQFGAVTEAELRQSVEDRTRENLQGVPEYLRSAVVEFQLAFLDGYTGDASHEEFVANVDEAQATLYEAIGRYAQAQVNAQVPDTIDVDERLGPGDRATVDQVASGVQLTNSLGTVLLVVGLLAVVGMVVLTHSVSRGARAAGGSLLVAGVLGVLASLLAGGVVKSAFRRVVGDVDQTFVLDTVEALITGVFDAMTGQFVVVVVLGVVLVAAYLVVDRVQPAAIPAAWR